MVNMYAFMYVVIYTQVYYIRMHLHCYDYMDWYDYRIAITMWVAMSKIVSYLYIMHAM